MDELGGRWHCLLRPPNFLLLLAPDALCDFGQLSSEPLQRFIVVGDRDQEYRLTLREDTQHAGDSLDGRDRLAWGCPGEGTAAPQVNCEERRAARFFRAR